MGRRRGVGDQTLRVAEIVRDIDEPQRIHEAEAALLIASDIEADESAALRHLLPCKFVLRVARQPRVEYAGNLGMSFELAGDCDGGAALPVDAKLERLEPFEQQP